MKIFSLFLTLLLVSCTPTDINTDNRGMRKVNITDTDGSKILSYSGSYALIIGQSDYAHWGDLNSIPSELDEVQSVLQDQNFVVERHKNLNSKDLKGTFEKFINNYGLDENNRLLFFYSGHGYSRLNNSKGYIVPVDAPDPNVDKKGFLDKAVGMNQVVTWARSIESKHALFLFDSCFSGTLFKSKNKPKIPRQITQAMAKPVRQFITAGSADEAVPAKSTFTPAFVDALRYAKADMYKDGYVTGEELGLYLKNTVQYFTNQTPQYGKIGDYKLNRGDFVFKVKNQSTPPVINVAELDSVKKEKAELARIQREQARLARINRQRKSKVFQDRLRDGGLAPKMVRIPAGSFRMGDIQGGGSDNEQPVHRVSVGKFAMGMYEVTRGEFRKFVNVTGYRTDAEKEGSCYTYKDGWNKVKGANWRNPNFSQNNNHPVACISWNDATAYTKWLSNQTGKKYRLPTEAEWEYAARAGTETKYWWGNTASHEYANYGSDSCCNGLAKGKDRWKYTSPVGSFSANKFGLYDTSGNVWEWTCSEYTDKYKGKEKACVTENNNKNTVLRGGSWVSSSMIRYSSRGLDTPDSRHDHFGFRVVLAAAWTN